ncbi:uncharacterized protein LOC105695571 isoform X2 [Orussus abietinus]|uniref:uncharacterized protein LOC105695571 isoform X2 n=1 Tax=Orussus abietinus TaxID=222816 RepID=UPI0006259BFA|nr:uncharacterized protein LOC105695571 isoform X2 [Orussus abietinus]
MKRIHSVRSEEDLESDLFCLKRELVLTLDENQLLKIKIRKLQHELQRKDKQIEHLLNPRKGYEFKSVLYEDVILKLQDRIKALEDMLYEQHLQKKKHYNEMKTVHLYTQTDYRKNRRGPKASTLNDKQPSSSEPKTSSAHIIPPINVKNVNVCKAITRNNPLKYDQELIGRRPQRNLSRSTISRTSLEEKSLQKYRRSNEICSESSRFMNAMNNLKKSQSIDKCIILSRNSEVLRLAGELKDTKEKLKIGKEKPLSIREQPYCQKSFRHFSPLSGRGLALNSKQKISDSVIDTNRLTSKVVTKGSGCEGSPFSRTKHIKDANVTCDSNKSFNFLNECQLLKLEAVQEQTEESLSDSVIKDCPERTVYKKVEPQLRINPKTKIEYVFDSEVSSDGEDICLTNNLRNFLQQVAITQSSDGENGNSLI